MYPVSFSVRKFLRCKNWLTHIKIVTNFPHLRKFFETRKKHQYTVYIYNTCMCCVSRYKTSVLPPELPVPWTDDRGADRNVVYGLYHWHVPQSGSGFPGRCGLHWRSSEGRYLPWWPPKYSMSIQCILLLNADKVVFIFNLDIFFVICNWEPILNASNLFMNFHHS